jgi:hypothetical protein
MKSKFFEKIDVSNCIVQRKKAESLYHHGNGFQDDINMRMIIEISELLNENVSS